MAGRGRKINQVKNNQAAREFAEGKKLGRPKQIWVADLDDDGRELPTGQWKKVGQ